MRNEGKQQVNILSLSLPETAYTFPCVSMCVWGKAYGGYSGCNCGRVAPVDLKGQSAPLTNPFPAKINKYASVLNLQMRQGRRISRWVKNNDEWQGKWAGFDSQQTETSCRSLVFKAPRCPTLQATFQPQDILTFTRTLLRWLCRISFPQYRRIYFSQRAPQSDAQNADTDHRMNEWQQWKKNVCMVEVRCWSLTLLSQ